ncbi:toll-like receptor 2 [Thalassophryne amazonica]|uniref:toll-like receptor 2 n=1 Tax=Thalassophryne amazonica TaxID=390379 RepID=UPI001470DCC1|nr:toll-like receptor 2 [Thalassophryne amazonica]
MFKAGAEQPTVHSRWDVMVAQSTNVVLVFVLLVFMSGLKLECSAAEDEEGFELCVSSRRQMRDLSHQNLTAVPLGLPDNLQYLDASHNSIRRLDADPFLGFSQLCFLKLTHCGLEQISPSVFLHTPALKILNISYNHLSAVPELSLNQLKVLDLANNLYATYQVPGSFQKLTKLEVLLLGSVKALSVNHGDFEPLTNTSLKHLWLGAGTQWQKYDSGTLSKIKTIEKFSLFAKFCGTFDILEMLLRDLNETKTRTLIFIRLFPDRCNVHLDPLKSLRTMPLLQDMTIANTWINSSFMEMVVKNIWLSSFRNVSFLDIVYNEDTPAGIQFHPINHTAGVCSITLNGITHYQYRYPTINISTDSFSSLTYIKFSRTGMNIIPCDILSTLPSLETLDLSDNLLTDTGFWWQGCSYTSAFPRLRRLCLSKNRFRNLSLISKNLHQMKTLESLDLSFNSIYLGDLCAWPTQLTELSLGNNNLGNSVFKYLSANFERIDLSKTGITVVTQEDMKQFPRLTHLDLSSNSIQVLPVDLSAPTLLSLSVDQNAITSIPQEVLAGLPRLQTLRAGNNPYVCSCASYWFIMALNKSLVPDWPVDYTCSMPPSWAGLPLSEYRPSRMSCEAWLQAAVAVPVVMAMSATVAALFYFCDGLWYTRMLWVWIRMKRRSNKRSTLLKNVLFSYHAFISYSHQDSNWVDSHLVSCLEGAGFSLCVHERDFVPGEWIIDNIINCVESSYKTLFVLSKHFVQSEWCNYELFFAQHRSISIQQDSLVFILLEPMPTDSLPKKFLRLRTLLRQQTYLEWSQDECKQHVFWASLKSMLHVADRSVVLKQVALAIADTVPLVTRQL